VAALAVLVGVATGGPGFVAEAEAAADLAAMTTAAISTAADDLGASVTVNTINTLAQAANDNAIRIAASAAGFAVMTFFASKTAAASMESSWRDRRMWTRSLLTRTIGRCSSAERII
jgi:hypothetical protein